MSAVGTMKAIGYRKSLPITDVESLSDIQLPQPLATGRDLLVKVAAIAVNPVDYKIRQNLAPQEGEHRVLGWDAVGEVVAAGAEVTQFRSGDVVYYAGDLNRQGSNAEYQLVDERLVGFKPKSLTYAEAAALPLTAITAWELLFEHLVIQQQLPSSTDKPPRLYWLWARLEALARSCCNWHIRLRVQLLSPQHHVKARRHGLKSLEQTT